MSRSKVTIISVKVPIRWDAMTERQKTRLSRITGRDTRVIKAYLGVIERHEKDLLVGKRKVRIHAGKLDELTLTAIRGSADRTTVLHDFKCRFPHVSVNEFKECRDTAIAMWHSYLERGGSRPLRSRSYSSRKIPRCSFKGSFKIVYTPEENIRHWLDLRDSLDSVPEGRRIHDRLVIPLSLSSFHLNQFGRGEVKTVRIFKDSKRKWWAIFTVSIVVESIDTKAKPHGVLAIDLGIKKAACSVILTRDGYRQVCYWRQKDKLRHMLKYDDKVAALQKKKEALITRGMDPGGITRQLREMSRKRTNISKEYDMQLVRDIANHVLGWCKKYDLYVVLGQLRGIRNNARRGNHRGRRFRGMIHRWSFARIREMLRYKLTLAGFDSRRFFAVNEAWTSIKCHRCGHKGIRPKQNLFICHTCGYRANADLNGAINIGRRIIKLISSLRDERGLGVWLLPREKSIPKASRTAKSKGKSSLPQGSPDLLRESVAECYEQTILVSSGSTKDPAMAKTVERPSVSKSSGSLRKEQRKETGSQGRNNVPMNQGKDHVTSDDSGHAEAGDSSRDKGGTQKFLAVHSQCRE